jgi:hypothetical protein
MSSIDKLLIDFSKYNNDEDYTKLEKAINKLLKVLNQTTNKDDKKKILENIDEIKKNITYKNMGRDISYPDYQDKNFIKKLLTKKEFAINKIPKMDNEILDKDFFELSNNQKFIKKLISPETPYRSIYLYHSVGVGKTCASIQISQNFKQYYSKKTLVLLPLKLKDNYIKELFDISKLSEDNMEQCLGNYYLHNIVGRDKMEMSDIKNKAKKMIMNEYEILSFGEFNSIFKKIEKISKNKKDFLVNIRNKFDDRVIITDEVHNMRITDEDDSGKEVTKSFLEMLEILNNNVLVLLSATPMFDNFSELNFILNCLLLQNGQNRIKNNMKIFDKNNKLNPEYEKILKKVSSNFISYMRGENPFTFPLRLYPSINSDKNILTKNVYPKKDIYGKKIDKNEQIKNLELVFTVMSKSQESIYNIIKFKDNDDNEDDDDSGNDDDEINKTDLQQKVQISNIIYDDDLDADIKSTYGNNGLKKVFKVEEGKVGKYKVEYKDRNNQILDKDNIKKYSPKIHLLLKNIVKAEGVILVYSRYLASGVIPIAIALEHIGYHKFNNKNILKNGNKTDKRGSYIIISGNKSLSPNNTKEIMSATNIDNINGDKIKIILITESGTEGLDLKYIRETHIFDPWYNLNRIEQVIGRSVRNYSHINLPETKRNTTIYQYVNMIDNKRETIDFRTYRIAENKQKNISLLEKIIKENAIDCNLNINANRFLDLSPIRLLTSKNKLIENYNRNDKTGSRICDYGKCDIKCENKVDISDIKNINDIDRNNVDTNNKLINTKTYKKEFLDYDIKLIEKYITKYFKENDRTDIKNLIKFLEKNKYKVKNNEILYFSLNQLVKNKNKLKGTNKRDGYLIYRYDNYIFQPLEIKDEKILLDERKKEKNKFSIRIDLTNYEPPEEEDNNNTTTNNSSSSNEDIMKKNEKYNGFIEKKLEAYKKRLLFDNNDVKKYNNIIYDMMIDNLNSKDFKTLIRYVLNKRFKQEYLDNVISSLKRGNYILDNNDIIYNYFTDKFMCRELIEGTKDKYKIQNCSPFQETQNRRLQKNKMKEQIKNSKIEKLGYNEIVNDEPVFKIIDLEKLKDKKSVTGTRCIVTTTISVKMLEGFIKKYDNSILKDKNTLEQIYKVNKYTKQNFCLIYQLILRNNKDKVLYVRPIMNNYLNKI